LSGKKKKEVHGNKGPGGKHGGRLELGEQSEENSSQRTPLRIGGVIHKNILLYGGGALLGNG